MRQTRGVIEHRIENEFVTTTLHKLTFWNWFLFIHPIRQKERMKETREKKEDPSLFTVRT